METPGGQEGSRIRPHGVYRPRLIALCPRKACGKGAKRGAGIGPAGRVAKKRSEETRPDHRRARLPEGGSPSALIRQMMPVFPGCHLRSSPGAQRPTFPSGVPGIPSVTPGQRGELNPDVTLSTYTARRTAFSSAGIPVFSCCQPVLNRLRGCENR